MATHRLSLFIAGSFLGGLISAGCMPVSNYHSAKTLGKGESSWGVTFSSTTWTAVDETGESDAITIPGVIPEFTYHIGLTDDLEVGGRVAPGFLYGEVDLKYRFLRSDKLHLAVAPALGQFSALVKVSSIRLPAILTYDINDMLSFNAAVHGSAWVVSDPESDYDSPFGNDEFLETTGVSVGLEIHGKTAFFRPSLEYTTAIFADDNDARFNLAAVVLHFGFIRGRELKKLEEMDEKLDRIEQNTMSWRNRAKPSKSGS